MRSKVLWAMPVLLIVGCGNPGRSPLKEADRKALIKPAAAKDGYGHAPKRTWAPAVEGLYQKLLSPDLGGDRLVVIQYGTRGALARGLALVRAADGEFSAIHAGIRFEAMGTTDWAQERVAGVEGDALWAQVEALAPEKTVSHAGLARSFRGSGAVLVSYHHGKTHHEANGWAPGALADQGIEIRYRALLALLREVIPEYPSA